MGDFEGQQGIKGTPTTILRNRAPKAMVGPSCVKRCFYGAKAIPVGMACKEPMA